MRCFFVLSVHLRIYIVSFLTLIYILAVIYLDHGVGTSTSAEAKDYFSNLDVHEVHFSVLANDVGPELSSQSIGNDRSAGDELIDMVFSKKKVMQRKSWLNNYKSDTFLSYGADILKYLL